MKRTALWWQPKIAVLALLGFGSGLPLYLTGRTLQAWMSKEGVDLTTIGLFSLVGLPYSLKFAWAPLVDRFVPPFLGRRRGWLAITQAGLILAIAAMSLHDPRLGLRLLAINAIIIAFLSASQDIVVDAYRTDVLEERERGAGGGIYVAGYRVGLIAASGLALFLADAMPWPAVYLAMAALMAVALFATFAAKEPAGTPPLTFAETVIDPFRDFFGRSGVGPAALALLFVVLFKLPDYLAATIATAFLLQLGFTQSDIGGIQGVLGLAVTIVGALGAGTLVARLGINRSLWVIGALQAISNLGYYLLALAGHRYEVLVAAIVVENFCAGLVAAGFMAFLMSLCSLRFSATQFALLSSLMGVSRDVLVSPAGAIAKATGWPTFFLLSLVAAIPGMLMLPLVAPWNRPSPVFAPRPPEP